MVTGSCVVVGFARENLDLWCILSRARSGNGNFLCEVKVKLCSLSNTQS